MSLADMIMEVYTVESCMLRTEKLIKLRGEEKCKNQVAMTQIYFYTAVKNVRRAGEEAIVAFSSGKE